MPKAKEWTELAKVDKGTWGQPGSSQYTIKQATVESNGDRFRVRIKDEHGSNQGYLQAHGSDTHQYRADSLDELMRIALSAEHARGDQAILTAIREAIYQAEDVEVVDVDVEVSE